MRATPAASPHFGLVEWALTATIALVWGASFLFIRIGLQTFGSGMVPTMRIAFGMAAIACVPRSHAKIDRADWPRVALLGLIWLALPFLLYSLAERTVSTAVTGIINGAIPLAAAAVGVALQRRRPSARRTLALVLGFAGVSLVALSASRGAHPTADTPGILMLVAAISCYGVSMNVLPPLQRRYGAFPVLFRAQMVALALSLPVAIASFPAAHFAWGALAAMVALGTLGTGLAYVALAILIGRTDATRGTIGNFLTPIVASLLGATLLHEPLTLAMLAGAALVLAGAYVTSHPEPKLPAEEGRLAVERAADE